jgi:hypothetical protein
MADAADSKSVARKGVWVRLPPPAIQPVRSFPRATNPPTRCQVHLNARKIEQILPADST